MTLAKTTKLIKIGLLVIIFGFALSPLYSHAIFGWIIEGFLKVMLLTPKLIAYLYGLIGSIIIMIGGLLINFTLNLNSKITDSALVIEGFNISLSVANLGFVLAIILIALGTILRSKTYQIKGVLWKLIVAAFLVNFSRAIAGVFIDFTGILSQFFVNAASPGNPFGFAANLVSAFNPQGFALSGFLPGGVSAFDVGRAVSNALLDLGTVIFTTVFTNIVGFAMIGTAGLILIRYLYLSFLLIIMPMAWLMWVLPTFSSYWKDWWNAFIKWTFFLPAALFFLYLAIVAPQLIAKDKPFDIPDPGVGDALGFMKPAENIMQMVLSLGLLVGGLYAAHKMGVTGAGIMMGAAKTAGTATLRVSKAIGKGTGAWALGGGAEKMQNLGKTRGGFLKTVTAPARWVGKGLGLAGKGAEKAFGVRPGYDPETGKPRGLLGSTLFNIKKEFEKKKPTAKQLAEAVLAEEKEKEASAKKTKKTAEIAEEGAEAPEASV